jgi:hypothetical protein
MTVENHPLYRAIRDLIGREAKANPNEMSRDQVAHVLIALLAKVINVTPLDKQRGAMTHGALRDIIQRIGQNLPDDLDDEPIDYRELN